MSDNRPLGLWSAIALVIGSMIGSGVFLLPATLAPYGAASLLGWGATMIGCLLMACVYAWLSRGFTASGGSYAYARLGFGDGAGFLIAWSNWVSMWCGNAALAVAFAGSLGAVIPAATATPLHGALCALAALWICTLVNIAGVREAGRLQLFTTLLKLVPLLLFGVIGLFYLRPGAYQPFNPGGEPLFAVTTACAAITLWAFLGFEAATIPAGSIRDAARTVPRATIIGMLVAGIATMLACTAVIGLLPSARLNDSAAPMAEAAAGLWGPIAGIGVGVVATVSCFGALNGWVMLQAQVPMAAARDGLFPAAFAKVNNGGAPWLGLLLSSLLATLLAVANYNASLVKLFTFSILLSTASALLPYAISIAAWLRMNGPAAPLRKVVAVLALAYALWALVGTGREALLWGAGLLLAGLPIYLWMKRRPTAAGGV